MLARPVKLVFSGIVILLAVIIAAYAFSYLSLSQTGFLESKDAALTTNLLWQLPFYAHIAFGGTALIIGGFQFIEPLRERYVEWHRLAGKVYVVSVFIASVTAFGVAFFAEAGVVAQAGFAILAILWLYTNVKAYTAIRRGDIIKHRTWMLRNYALTFAAVTLRFWLPFELAVLGMNFPDAYRIVAWLCWVPNLIFAEFLVHRLRSRSPLAV